VIVDEATASSSTKRHPLIISAPRRRGRRRQRLPLSRSVQTRRVPRTQPRFHHRPGRPQLRSHQPRRTAPRSSRETESAASGKVNAAARIGHASLNARWCFVKDEQYLVNEDKEVQIIDEYTGRVMEDRSWRHGPSPGIEVKEEVPVSAIRKPRPPVLPKILPKLPEMSGMTGTAWEPATKSGTSTSAPSPEFPPTNPASQGAPAPCYSSMAENTPPSSSASASERKRHPRPHRHQKRSHQSRLEQGTQPPEAAPIAS